MSGRIPEILQEGAVLHHEKRTSNFIIESDTCAISYLRRTMDNITLLTEALIDKERKVKPDTGHGGNVSNFTGNPGREPETSRSTEDDTGKLNPTSATTTAENKRQSFIKYLEQIGFIQAMTQVVVELYEEPVKPLDPIEYFLNRIVTNVPLKESLKEVNEEIGGLEKKLTALMNENQTLAERLLRHEKIPDAIGLEQASHGKLDMIDNGNNLKMKKGEEKCSPNLQ